MLKIGLTGGIGSGKTTASGYFSALNIPVIDADEIARNLLTPDGPAYQKVIDTFGDRILDNRKLIDRSRLRALVFEDPAKRKALEEIIHPHVRSEINRQLEKTNAPYCIIVIPLLIEAGYADFVDNILVIDADESAQMKRVKERNGLNENEIKNIMSAQVDRQKRLAHADEIITNDGSLNELKRNVEQLHEQYTKMAPLLSH